MNDDSLDQRCLMRKSESVSDLVSDLAVCRDPSMRAEYTCPLTRLRLVYNPTAYLNSNGLLTQRFALNPRVWGLTSMQIFELAWVLPTPVALAFTALWMIMGYAIVRNIFFVDEGPVPYEVEIPEPCKKGASNEIYETVETTSIQV